ncbi:MAG: DUF2157 domain-containing protein, partial [Rhizobiales bacterium]|nr:DUF2157 domain-containing protein [Rhizobacter sp.]
RPGTAAWRAFAARLLLAAGLGAIGAGVLFFVAANWQQYGVLGRFALLQAVLLVCVAVALWRPPPSLPGQSALILATLLTGGLLALFGQSYQTGADVHELFFTWALLALPFALAGLSGALWAVWWSVLNIALALLCGWLGADHFVWRLIAGWGMDRSALLMLPCIANLLAAGAYVALRDTRFAPAAPGWLARYLLGLGLLYGTAAVLVVITGEPSSNVESARSGSLREGGQGAAIVLLFATISVGIALATWRAKRDVFPLALVSASWIAISTTWLARTLRFNDIGTFFLIAVWLVAASTATGLLLMHWVRAWRAAPTQTTEGAAA